MLVPALVVALTLAFTGAASAQTPFQATVSAPTRLPAPCSNGAFVCGTANLAGYGAASCSILFNDFTVVQTSCGSTYTDATIYFTLDSDPGSTLVLNDSGNFCFPGNDGATSSRRVERHTEHPLLHARGQLDRRPRGLDRSVRPDLPDQATSLQTSRRRALGRQLTTGTLG